jgi:septum formation protein
MVMLPNPKMKKVRLILASASPRRRELLAALERPFDVIAPDIDESVLPGEAPASFALRMAHEKAQAVVSGLTGGEPVCIIAADTIVVLYGKILGKPAGIADATATLHALSGQCHVVITGLCVWHRDDLGHTMRGDAVRTSVTFRELTRAEIHHYVASGEPMDKAGSYAIQGGAAGMIDHIDGSYSNVVGLPMETLVKLLA